MYRFTINAGHGLYTAGKRCLKSIDPKQTSEWSITSPIVERTLEILEDEYTGFEYLRLDDPTGKRDIPLKERTDKANKFKPDDGYSVHANTGIKGGKGGGAVVYTYTKVDESTKELQKLLYSKLIEHTGLKGNRANPLGKADFHECRETNFPYVLGEVGFMDSQVDTPIILTKEFREQCARAYAETIAIRGKLQKKPKPVSEGSERFRVQVGYFSKRENAEELVSKLKSKGFEAIIKVENAKRTG